MSATLSYAPEAVHDSVIGRQRALEQRVLLLAPSFGWWIGQYQLPRDHTVVTVDNQEVDNEDVTTSRAKLMQKKYPRNRDGVAWYDIFRKIKGAQESIISRYSVPFPIRGVRIIAKSAGRAFFDELFGLTLGQARSLLASDDVSAHRRARLEEAIDSVDRKYPGAPGTTPLYDATKDTQSVAYRLQEAADAFVEDLDDVLSQIRTHTNPTIWASVEKKIPKDRHKMRAKFYMDATPVEIAGGDHSTVTADDLATHADVVREACRRKVNEAIESMISGPRDELAATLANLQELIDRDGRITARSFEPVREAIRKVRLFDFVTNDQLMEQIEQLERRLDVTTPTGLDRATAAASGFSAALRSVASEIQDAQQQLSDLENFGRMGRSIVLD